MYRRIELHNHTTESDGTLTVEQLLNHMLEDRVDAFAITDHNTISGHQKLRNLLEENKERRGLPQCLYGMEYTTYYGHILCPIMENYISWENINYHKPEALFQSLKDAGSIVGIAHPFSEGHPISRGCHFDMVLSDYSCIDFIEVINNPEPLYEVNGPGITWWEELVFSGHPLAVTAGMDLHHAADFEGCFSTFIKYFKGESIKEGLQQSILTKQTHVSKGLILELTLHLNLDISSRIVETSKSMDKNYKSSPLFINLKTKKGELTIPYTGDHQILCNLSDLPSSQYIIPKLYEKSTSLKHLIAIAPAMKLS